MTGPILRNWDSTSRFFAVTAVATFVGFWSAAIVSAAMTHHLHWSWAHETLEYYFGGLTVSFLIYTVLRYERRSQ